MFLSSPLLRPSSCLKTQHHPSPFLHGGFPPLPNPNSRPIQRLTAFPSISLPVRAEKKVHGRVVTAVHEKTVSVEVVRLAVHPKYKRRIRIKKRFQAHDPENQFKVGDVVELKRSRPISKMKHFLAVPAIDTHAPRAPQPDGELPPLQSEAEAQE